MSLSSWGVQVAPDLMTGRTILAVTEMAGKEVSLRNIPGIDVVSGLLPTLELIGFSTSITKLALSAHQAGSHGVVWHTWIDSQRKRGGA